MSRLFEPIAIHDLVLKNRLVMPPMATAKADETGGVTDAVCAYYQERALYSKIGLIITEHSYVSQQGKAHPGQTSLAEEETIPGWRRLTDCVHQEGVRIFAQLSHAGTAASYQVTGQAPVGPSAICHPKQQKELPVEMTVRQIQETVQAFGEAARRAREAGFDGVEIHSAHGYLLNQFYSPLANHRSDAYGSQSVENRTRFHREVLQAVRRAAGEDFPVSVRLGGCDYQEGGSTLEDSTAAFRILAESGTDLLHLTGGMNGFVRPGHQEPGYFQDVSRAARQAVQIPVLLTGGVTTLAQAQALLEEGCADLIGVGRAIFRDSHWAD